MPLDSSAEPAPTRRSLRNRPAPEPTIDEFAEAAKLFSFTGETAVQAPPAPAASSTATARTASHTAAITAPRTRRWFAGSAFRRMATASFSVGVMGVVGLLTVAMTVPAEAVAASAGAPVAEKVSTSAAPKIESDEIQAYVAPADVTNVALDRAENYTSELIPKVAAVGSGEGILYQSDLFTNDVTAAVQWPFSVGVGMSSGYGMRWGRLHEGVDFVPGEGAPIQAIADGTVRIATESGGNYGVTVYIDHVINGKAVTSHYSHMQYGSLKVSAGEQVTVGTIVGNTGNTGRSYGAHLHFEIIVNGSTVDPLPWLRENAGG